MNLTTARATLTERGFQYLSTTQVDLALNNAKNALEDLLDWPWLETTAPGAAPLTISDLKHILYVVDTTNDRELLGLDPRDIVNINTDVDATGTPEYWWLDGLTSLKVYPANTANTLSVRYVKYSPELSDGSDTPLIPTRYHPIWLDFAVVEALKEGQNYQAANALLSDLMTRRMPGMLDVFAGRNSQNPEYQVISPVSSEDW